MVLLPTYVEVEGLRFPGSFDPKRVRSAMKYLPTKDDLFLVTYPKCGTTWLHQIVYLILTRGKPAPSPKEFLDRVPFIEMMGQDGFDRLIKPGALKTHLTIDTIPYSTEAKYIYMSRNPKDTCVSFFEHTRSIPGYKFQDGKFDDYFDIFMDGRVNYNDYFHHIRSWYDRRQRDNVLFLSYEEVKDNPKKMIRAMAEFMGQEYSRDCDQDPRVLEDIVYYSSFDAMKNTTNEVMRHMVPNGAPPRVNVDFVRQGNMGGWRQMMTKIQSDRIDQKVRDALGDTELPAMWRRFNCL